MHLFLKRCYFLFFNLTHNPLCLRALPLLVRSARKFSIMKECRFYGMKCGRIEIGERCSLSGVRFFMSGNGNAIRIGSGVTVVASKHQPTYFNVCGGTSITIGTGCLFSNSIEVHTTDYHSILDNGKVTNPPADVTIGENCWIGLRSIILKGVHLQEGTVVGCCSTVTKSFDQKGILIAGNPAKLIRQDIGWRK